jgi:hypothetical protein
MSLTILKTGRRYLVVANYGSLLLLMIFTYIGFYSGWSYAAIIGTALSFLLTLVSFFILFVKTSLWKQVHSGIEELDEREIQVNHESLRISYSIFTIVCLSILLASELTKEWFSRSTDLPLMPVIAILIYLAHTLPAAIIAWREKVI